MSFTFEETFNGAEFLYLLVVTSAYVLGTSIQNRGLLFITFVSNGIIQIYTN